MAEGAVGKKVGLGLPLLVLLLLRWRRTQLLQVLSMPKGRLLVLIGEVLLLEERERPTATVLKKIMACWLFGLTV